MMNTIAFPIPRKEDERRRALLPSEIASLKHAGALHFEEGYGQVLGATDEDYREVGAHISSYTELLEHSVICCMKSPDADEAGRFRMGRNLLFGRMHAVQGRAVTDLLISRELSAVAREDMHAKGRHVFWENNQIAGYVAILHACTISGRSVAGARAALIGRGNTAHGAHRALSQLGAETIVCNRIESPRLRLQIGRQVRVDRRCTALGCAS